MSALGKLEGRDRRKRRIRKKVNGTAARPRLCVFRSNMHMYAQAVDDEAHKVLAGASSLSPEVVKAIADKKAGGETVKKSDVAVLVGKLVAERCQAKSIKAVVFDRSGYQYTGRVKTLADAAREAGLEF
jgi:large subunit ribosomal protein L18